MAYCGLSAAKCQHCTAQKGYPPHLETDIKRVLTSDDKRGSRGRRHAAATVVRRLVTTGSTVVVVVVHIL